VMAETFADPESLFVSSSILCAWRSGPRLSQVGIGASREW
jgi:hypothetical protein